MQQECLGHLQLVSSWVSDAKLPADFAKQLSNHGQTFVVDTRRFFSKVDALAEQIIDRAWSPPDPSAPLRGNSTSSSLVQFVATMLALKTLLCVDAHIATSDEVYAAAPSVRAGAVKQWCKALRAWVDPCCALIALAYDTRSTPRGAECIALAGKFPPPPSRKPLAQVAADDRLRNAMELEEGDADGFGPVRKELRGSSSPGDTPSHIVSAIMSGTSNSGSSDPSSASPKPRRSMAGQIKPGHSLCGSSGGSSGGSGGGSGSAFHPSDPPHQALCHYNGSPLSSEGGGMSDAMSASVAVYAYNSCSPLAPQSSSGLGEGIEPSATTFGPIPVSSGRRTMASQIPPGLAIGSGVGSDGGSVSGRRSMASQIPHGLRNAMESGKGDADSFVPMRTELQGSTLALLSSSGLGEAHLVDASGMAEGKKRAARISYKGMASSGEDDSSDDEGPSSEGVHAVVPPKRRPPSSFGKYGPRWWPPGYAEEHGWYVLQDREKTKIAREADAANPPGVMRLRRRKSATAWDIHFILPNGWGVPHKPAQLAAFVNGPPVQVRKELRAWAPLAPQSSSGLGEGIEPTHPNCDHGVHISNDAEEGWRARKRKAVAATARPSKSVKKLSDKEVDAEHTSLLGTRTAMAHGIVAYAQQLHDLGLAGPRFAPNLLMASQEVLEIAKELTAGELGRA